MRPPTRLLRPALAAAAVVIALACGTPSQASAAPSTAKGEVDSPRVVLGPGQVLYPYRQMWDLRSDEHLVVWPDGNLVLYRGAAPVWQTRRYLPSATWARLVVQPDGNLVSLVGLHVLWETRTWGHPDARLVLQADGNLVLYQGRRPLWATSTTEQRPPVTPPQPAGPTGPRGNPSGNWPVPSAFDAACVGTLSGPVPLQACDAVALIEIDDARRAERLGPLQLPAGFGAEPPARQVVTVTNAERTSRGLAAATPSAVLDRYALAGAEHRSDPGFPSGVGAAASVWAGGYGTPLAADFGWMYDDGPGGPNIDCTASHPQGCWGHRHDLLSDFPGAEIGTAVTDSGGAPSIAAVLVEPTPAG